MIRTNFPESNVIISPPEGMTEDEAGGSAFAYKGISENGVPLIITCWKPTLDEIDNMMEGGRVWLVVMGHIVSPAVVTAINPLE